MPSGFLKNGTKRIPPSRKGVKLSDDIKRKMSLRMKGNTRGFKKGIVGFNRGKHFSVEHRKKLSLVKIGRKLSEEHKNKISIKNKGKRNYFFGKHIFGKNHPAWKGGITPINAKIRTSKEYKLWRKAVFERDNYTCIWCGQKGGELNADHIKPFALFPELRFAIDNGRTLCVDCHRKTDTYGWKLFIK